MTSTKAVTDAINHPYVFAGIKIVLGLILVCFIAYKIYTYLDNKQMKQAGLK